MMKNILILLLFITCTNSALTKSILDGLEKSYQSNKHNDLKEYLDGLRDQSTKKIQYRSQNLINREICSDYFESKYELEQSTLKEGTTGSYSVDRFTIRLIHLKNKILYYRIEEIKHEKNLIDKWVKVPHLVKEKRNTRAYENLEKTYLTIYPDSLNFEDLFVNNIAYGSNCGIGGQDPEYRKKLNLLIEKKDKKTLLKWLSCATTELQLYAIEGILDLSRKGIRFKDDSYDLIKRISKKKGDVYTCSGCTHWNRPIHETVKAIFVMYGFRDT